MEKINEILDKYFKGISTIEEENILKKYFTSGHVKPEHLAYKPLFEVFELEAKISFPPKTKRQIKRFQLRTFLYTSSGVAAAILLIFWLFGSPAMQGDYAIVNGTRINDNEIAQQMAQSKINKVGEMLQGKLKPLESLETVKNRLEPAKKVFEIRNDIINIQQKLNFE
ncbi:MAG: hypothetical protein VB102_12805 [Paludibacter sp.]|nr:hypothetical protein [Paludibacter sp.]